MLDFMCWVCNVRLVCCGQILSLILVVKASIEIIKLHKRNVLKQSVAYIIQKDN